jgi:hypothetical protein
MAMRDLDSIDHELSVLAGIRRRARSRGGPESSASIDQLLDERNELTRRAEIPGEVLAAHH